MNIEFDSDNHIYTVDGRRVPSVTDICSPITDEHYGSINSAILEMASRRGTAVHEATELMDFGELPEDDPEIEGYINAYLDFLLDYQPKWNYIEWIGYNDELNYCGTIDRAGTVGNEFWVMDIKTTASPNRANYIATCCQTRAYAMMLEAEQSCKRKILYLKKDGSYRIVDCEDKEAELALDSFYLFTKLCQIKNYISKVKETKKRGSNKKGTEEDQ